MYKVGMVSLGCAKNQVDAEIMLAKLRDAGMEITGNEYDADCVIVNTCGFIEDAKKEAIENILELAEIKKNGGIKALVVTGCLAERYKEEVKKELGEVDAVIGIGADGDIAEVVKNAIEGRGEERFPSKYDFSFEGERILTTPRYTAYLKISDGCDNNCTYCTIPSIRGRYRSRSIESILAEAASLADRGVKELIVVAQDPTCYGKDLYGEVKICDLLEKLAKIEKLEWIRVLYIYPERFTDELIEVFKKNEKLLDYFDIPIQHCNGDILRRMNRQGDRKTLTELIEKIRKELPDAVLRTTFITGFPGESEEQFTELCEFVKEVKFDRLGCFAYSAEENTMAANMPDQIDDEVKLRRSEVIMDAQLRVVEEKNQQLIGGTMKVLCEGYDDYIKCCYGRTYRDAPEIDAKVFFMASGDRPQPGDFVDVEVTDTIGYDLLGCQTEA